MTPTDIMPARFTPTADTGAVRGTAGKSGKDDGNGGEAGFRDLLKQIAGDKEQPQQKTADGVARAKAASTQARAATQDASKAALSEIRGRLGKEARLGHDKDEKTDADGDLEAKGEDADAAAASGDGKTGAIDTPINAVAMLLSLAQKGEAVKGQAAMQSRQGDAKAGAVGAADADAAAVAETAMRDVKVGSVKVETHFAAVHTDAATTGFAQRLALAQMSGTSGQGGRIGESAGKSGTQTGIEPGGVSGTSATGDVRQTRGQMFAARGDRHGADSAGTGANKSGGDSKAAAAPQAAAPAQRATPSSADATQAGAIQTPLQQLSDRLLMTAHELQQAASATPASSVSSDPNAVSSAPVRVLSINLHPEELGTVTVRMSMVAGSLDVQIDAEMPDTAQMLRTDTDQISDLLRSAGIQVDGITVRAASPDFVSTSAGNTPSFFDQQSQPQSQSGGGAQSDARGFGGQQRGDDPSQQFGRSGNFGQDDESRSRRSSGSGLYV